MVFIINDYLIIMFTDCSDETDILILKQDKPSESDEVGVPDNVNEPGKRRFMFFIYFNIYLFHYSFRKLHFQKFKKMQIFWFQNRINRLNQKILICQTRLITLVSSVFENLDQRFSLFFVICN